jgi:osmotically-inducible protein OsmY
MTMQNPDHALKTDVLAELAWEPMLDADHIGVTARDGVVTLSGHVDSYWQKHAAEVAVGRVHGVKGIAEGLAVRLPTDHQRADEEIAAAAVNRLDWDATLPPGAVMVQVQDGCVTLSGTVPHQFQRQAAEAAVRSLWGVTAVANEIAIPVPAKPANPNRIADDIRRALNRGWFAADTVHVAALGGIVTLSGKAETLRDRTLAVETAWAAPGTARVENHIRIG